ncbi:MAG: protein-methionine-sulfoxide reductase catalytic subunit MsrP [Acetobacteraceae bacterium]|jgi:sulfoxide reductase catalytic subunit YedY|nr:protein-methionine-sulfoxide reductase catalytic subunit MsrP [Acetobacteraceae bacterium]
MNIHRRKPWQLPEREATPEEAVLAHGEAKRSHGAKGWGLSRRALFGGAAGLGAVGLAGGYAAYAQGRDPIAWWEAQAANDPSRGLYPAARTERFTLDRPLTAPREAITYNNFYEFGSHKGIWQAAQRLETRPWTVTIDGLVATPKTVDIDTLIKLFPLEERLYRFRCVEAWAMAVPWTGFPMASLIRWAEPQAGARYVLFETFQNPAIAPGFRQTWYPWPYRDAFTIEECTNELAFMATGIYGKPLPPQMGSPIRPITPWKYGFKQPKSVVRISFVADRPVGYWEKLQPSEYGFWANVNPEVSHPRWSQATERMLGTGERRPTLIWNGYGEQVAGLYTGLSNERLFA